MEKNMKTVYYNGFYRDYISLTTLTNGIILDTGRLSTLGRIPKQVVLPIWASRDRYVYIYMYVCPDCDPQVYAS